MDVEKLKAIIEISMQPLGYASQTVQLFISLATGALAFSVTFSKEILPHGSRLLKKYLVIAWAFYVLSILCGVFAIMALTGVLTGLENLIHILLTDSITPKQIEDYLPSIVSLQIIIPAMLQVSFFMIAILFTTLYGFKSLSRSRVL